MSGPLPTFAATAAFGRMSSKFSLSTRTGTPVARVNASVFFIHCSSSPATKRFQRSTRNCASFSGSNRIAFAACASPARIPAAAVDAAAAPIAFNASRRVYLLMISSCCCAFPAVPGNGPGFRPARAGGNSSTLNARVLDVEDFQVDAARGAVPGDGISDARADQRLGERRAPAHLVFCHVRLVLADDGEMVEVAFLVFRLHGSAEMHFVRRF